MVEEQKQLNIKEHLEDSQQNLNNFAK